MADIVEKMRLVAGWAEVEFNGVPTTFPIGKSFAVNQDGLIFGCHLSEQANATGLLVWLFGTTSAAGRRPVLGLRSIGQRINYSTLVISDPSLFLDPEMQRSAFLGTRDLDPMPGVVRIATAVAKNLGVEPEQIVFAGGSSGGYAAIQAACLSGARAIALNPQLDIPSAAAVIPGGDRVRALFEPSMSFDEWGEKFPTRVNAFASLKKARGEGRRPMIVLCQNIVDRLHHDDHFIPFCEATGLPKTGGISPDGDLKSCVLSYPEGHGATPEAVNQILDAGSNFFSSGE